MFENKTKQFFLTSPTTSADKNQIINNINDIKCQISITIANYPNPIIVKRTAQSIGLPYHLFTNDAIQQYLNQNLPISFYSNLLHYVKQLQAEFSNNRTVANSCEKAQSSHNYRIRSEKKNIESYLMQKEVEKQIYYQQFMSKFYGKDYQTKAEKYNAKKAEKAKKFNQKANEIWQQQKNIQKDKIDAFKTKFIQTCMQTKPKFHRRFPKNSYGSVLDQLSQSPQLSPIKVAQDEHQNASSRNIKSFKHVNSCHTIQLNNLFSFPNKQSQSIINDVKILRKQINNTVHLASIRQKRYKQKRQIFQQLQDKQKIQKMVQKFQKIDNIYQKVKIKRKDKKCTTGNPFQDNCKDLQDDKMILNQLQNTIARKEKFLQQRKMKIKRELQTKQRRRQNYHSQYIKKIQKQNQQKQPIMHKKSSDHMQNFFRQANIKQHLQAQQRIDQFNQLSLKLRKIPSKQLKKKLREIKEMSSN